MKIECVRSFPTRVFTFNSREAFMQTMSKFMLISGITRFRNYSFQALFVSGITRFRNSEFSDSVLRGLYYFQK